MHTLNNLLLELRTAASECETKVSAVIQRIGEVNAKLAEAQALVARLRDEAQALVLDRDEASNNWTRIQSDVEAVERTLALAGSKVHVADLTAAPVTRETYGTALMEILGRNPDSTKEWSVAEIKAALSKRWEFPPSTQMDKNIRVNLDIAVKKGQVVKKDSAARGVVVYQLR